VKSVSELKCNVKMISCVWADVSGFADETLSDIVFKSLVLIEITSFFMGL
jgi:hypothetical protein